MGARHEGRGDACHIDSTKMGQTERIERRAGSHKGHHRHHIPCPYYIRRPLSTFRARERDRHIVGAGVDADVGLGPLWLPVRSITPILVGSMTINRAPTLVVVLLMVVNGAITSIFFVDGML